MPKTINLSSDDNSDDSSVVVLPHKRSKQAEQDPISVHSTESELEATAPAPSVNVEQCALPSAILRIPAALIPAGDLEIQVSLQGSVTLPKPMPKPMPKVTPKEKQPSDKATKALTPAKKKHKINVLSSHSFASPSTASTSKASTSHAHAPSKVSSTGADRYLVIISREMQSAIYLNPSNHLVDGVKGNPMCVYRFCDNLEDAVEWFKLSLERN